MLSLRFKGTPQELGWYLFRKKIDEDVKNKREEQKKNGTYQYPSLKEQHETAESICGRIQESRNPLE
jgi:hypothetical protein